MSTPTCYSSWQSGTSVCDFKHIKKKKSTFGHVSSYCQVQGSPIQMQQPASICPGWGRNASMHVCDSSETVGSRQSEVRGKPRQESKQAQDQVQQSGFVTNSACNSRFHPLSTGLPPWREPTPPNSCCKGDSDFQAKLIPFVQGAA